MSYLQFTLFPQLTLMHVIKCLIILLTVDYLGSKKLYCFSNINKKRTHDISYMFGLLVHLTTKNCFLFKDGQRAEFFLLKYVTDDYII